MLYLSAGITLMLIILAFALGTVLGSFLNCTAWRIVHGESVVRGRSHCAECHHTLASRDLVPVVSWLALHGKCRYCGKPVSKRYIVAELIGGAMAVSLLLRYDVSWGLALYAYLLFLLFCTMLVDYEDGWLPDRFALALAIGFFPLGYLYGGASALVQGLIGAAALFFPVLGVSIVMSIIMKKRAQREAGQNVEDAAQTDSEADAVSDEEEEAGSMGGGDLKLFAVLGLYFGWKQGILLVLLACVFGIFYSKVVLGRGNREPFRFAPALFAAAWVTALIGDPLITWYLSLF